MSEQLSACSKHSDVIERLWSAHVAPAEKELQQARDAIASCLAANAIVLSPHPSAADLMKIAFPPDGLIVGLPPEPYRGCAERAAKELGIMGRYYGQ